jgi:phosphohistidine phosphatase SixA
MARALILLHTCLALAAIGCGGDDDGRGGDGLAGELRNGGLVLVLRHAATETREEPESLRSCSLQRNLSAGGRRQARAIGAAMREQEIPIGDVRASPMCRTRDTAELAFGRATVDRRLLSPGVVGTIEDDERRARQLRELVRAAVPAGTNTILVTHTGNIGAALGESVDEGELLAYDEGRLLGSVKADEWDDLT